MCCKKEKIYIYIYTPLFIGLPLLKRSHLAFGFFVARWNCQDVICFNTSISACAKGSEWLQELTQKSRPQIRHFSRNDLHSFWKSDTFEQKIHEDTEKYETVDVTESTSVSGMCLAMC